MVIDDRGVPTVLTVLCISEEVGEGDLDVLPAEAESV
tara:strand:+ start:640 stop:750 length:111 start_codon:yes stop_codon:yes gene_type:complete